MTKELVTTEEKALTLGMDRQIVVTPDQMVVVKNTIFPDSTDDELKLFIYHCQRKGVHPMDKLIHPIKRGGKVAFQASIDYLRAEAESAGDYRGMKQPIFEMDENNRLESATVTVIREVNGIELEYTATAYWSEFCPAPPNDFMWKKMPRHMLAKCAEAQARRQAWPKKLADLYTPEEMAQADNPRSADQNKQAQRSASVRPAQQPPPRQHQTQHQNVQDAQIVEHGGGEGDEVPLSEKIDLALDYLTGGDEGAKKNLLIEASRGGKSAGAFLLYSKLHLPETSQPWLQRILEYLEPKVWEKQSAEAE